MASLQQGGALASFLPHGFMGIQAPAGRVPEDAPGAKWTHEEHSKFLIGLERFRGDDVTIGRNGKPFVGLGPGISDLISAFVGTRNARQVRSHAQKFFLAQARAS